MAATMEDLAASIASIAADWRTERAERQARRHLERADFDALRDAGLLRAIAPLDDGGLWEGIAISARPLCRIHRTLASADASVALVSSMHASVIAFWLATPDATQPEWEEQRHAVFRGAVAGERWGTITSEPGSGGDIARTRAVARPSTGATWLPGRAYSVSGEKHFGSGSGITDRMVTTAVPEGESAPTIFAFDVRDRPWDGSAGLQLVAEWDGMGMAATQSHAMRLDDVPAVRLAFDGPLDTVARAAGPIITGLFASVVLGVLDEAMALAREQVRSRSSSLRAYEQVEWTRAEQGHWLAVQAHEGALRAIESGPYAEAIVAGARAKLAIAELAEDTLRRIARVLGGGTFSQRSPFARWFEDVRALGFLRPPWGLAYDNLFTAGLA